MTHLYILRSVIFPVRSKLHMGMMTLLKLLHIIRNVKQPTGPDGQVNIKKPFQLHPTTINKPAIVRQRPADQKLQHPLLGLKWKINIILVAGQIQPVPQTHKTLVRA